ncbi:hypothetical protein GCM10022243_14230 [Saccharothrix violaceirubra]|uniref:Fibronectin type-III domain-containing protein n=1 Tax=Saccharothrix violaceirubra TaxID=413306 RepID=A0A7W7T657_9PSEU|nr:spherulation-specific family 4 protein [Saccharothrix violaceirubra]MBB4967298.1 hypothetical protein [Saccharothrix violaceirubra]
MTRLSTVSARIGVAVATVALVAPAPLAHAEPVQHAAIPAYWSPDTPDGRALFHRLAGNHPTTGIVVVNGSLSRPEAPHDAAWADAISTVHASGARALVYVDTGYLGVDLGQGSHHTREGEISPEAWLAQAKVDVDGWYSLYGDIDGVFLDQTLSACGPDNLHVRHYADLVAYVKAHHPGAYVVLNPGRAVEECYADVADTILTFEGSRAAYLAHTPPAWELARPDRKKFWHLVYDVPADAMPAVVARSKANGAGYVYVTDRAHDPYPWDTIATYWDEELGHVAGVEDVTSPETPKEIRAAVSPTEVVLRWTPSRDDVAVVDYEILLGRTVVGTTFDTAYTATGLVPGGTYTFRVRARDSAGNTSATGNPVTVTTPVPQVHHPTACVTATSARYAASFVREFPHQRVFVDSDDDATTGYPLPPGLPQGVDHMIEGGVLYRHSGAGWTWTAVTDVAVTSADGTTTWELPTSAYGQVATRQVVVFNGYDGVDEYSEPITVTIGDTCT